MAMHATSRQLTQAYGTLRASVNLAATCLALLEIANLTGLLDTVLFVNLAVSAIAWCVFTPLMHEYRKRYPPVSAHDLAAYGLDGRRPLGGVVYGISGGLVLLAAQYALAGNCGLAGAAAVGLSLGWAGGFYLLPELDYYAAVQAAKPVTTNN